MNAAEPKTAEIRIRLLDGDGTGWDSYVRAHARHSVYHLSSWRDILARSVPARFHYLYAEREGRICGVLPLVEQRSVLFGRRLTSLPFATQGGPLTDDTDSERLLLDHAVERAADCGATYLEVRNMLPIAAAQGLQARQHRTTMLLPLDRPAGDILKGFHATRRRQVRRSIEGAMCLQVGGVEMLEPFYRVFSANMRDLGTPVYPKRYFRAMLEIEPSHFGLAVVWIDGSAVAGALLGHWRSTIEVPLVSSLRQHRDLYPNAFMYWRIIEHAIERGFSVLDLGRSVPGSGTHHFKTQFGATEVPLLWNYWTRNGAPPQVPSRSTGAFRLLTAAWSRLPLAIANTVGPVIASRLY